MEEPQPGDDARDIEQHGAAREELERRVMERTARLADSEEKWRSLVTTAPHIILIYDLDARITYINRLAPGYRMEDVIGQRGEAFIHPDHQQLFVDRFNEVVETREVRALEVRSDAPDGSITWYSSRMGPFTQSGRLVGVTCITADVTERKQQDDALEQQNAHVRMLASQLPAIAWTTDRSLTFTSSHGQTLRQLSLTPDEVVGTTVGDYLDQTGADPSAVLAAHEAALRGEAGTYEADVGGRIFESSVEPLRNADGEIVGCIGVAVDLTTQRRAELQLREAEEQLSALRAQMHMELALTEERERRRIASDLHDQIGQTLGVLRMRLQTARQTSQSPELAEELGICVDLVAQTIRETRTLMFDLSPPVLYDIGFEAAAEWLVEQQQRENDLKIAYTDDGRPKPLGDESSVILFRAVRELLINIGKHARADRASLSLRSDNGNIRIECRDDGVGFDPGVRPVVREDHTGFGLFSLREQINRLGGTVVIDSAPGSGTCVTIVAPLETEAQ